MPIESKVDKEIVTCSLWYSRIIAVLLKLFLYVYRCVCVFTCVWVYVCASMCMPVEVRGWHKVIALHFLYLRQGLLLKPELANSARQALYPRSPLPSPNSVPVLLPPVLSYLWQKSGTFPSCLNESLLLYSFIHTIRLLRKPLNAQILPQYSGHWRSVTGRVWFSSGLQIALPSNDEKNNCNYIQHRSASQPDI